NSDAITQGANNLFMTTDERSKINYKEALLFIEQYEDNDPIVVTFKNDFKDFQLVRQETGIFYFIAEEDLSSCFAIFNQQISENELILSTTQDGANFIICQSSTTTIGDLARADSKLKGYLYIRKYND